MKLQSLSTLTSVVACGSFAAAAEQVNLTPSAVSLQMKQLEAYFRQPLFDRSLRNVRPTAFALELSKILERATADIEAMRDITERTPAGRVRLGITESALTTLLPPAFAELRRDAPQIDLHMERGSTPGLLTELKAGHIDAAVLVRPVSGGSSRLRWTHLLTETFVLITPPDAPRLTVAETLRRCAWIRLDRNLVAGRLAARFVNQIAPNLPALVDVPGIDAIVAMVAAGIGVSVIPRTRLELRAAYPVREIGLGRHAPQREIVMVRRTSDAETGAWTRWSTPSPVPPRRCHSDDRSCSPLVRSRFMMFSKGKQQRPASTIPGGSRLTAAWIACLACGQARVGHIPRKKS